MKNILQLILCCAITLPALAQQKPNGPKPATFNIYTAVDAKMQEIPKAETNTTKDVAAYINASFSTESEKARAIFIWTASSFEYDVTNMFALNFHETQQEKIDKVMKLRKGICENYAAVFNDLCRQCGLTSYVIFGYTRHNGQTADLAHAWCAAIVDGEYCIFDPTWGSGYVTGKQFTRRINNDYFMCKPAAMIKSHLPFDPMWQLLNYPITAEDFAEDKTTIDKTKPFFSYADSITAHEQLTVLQQMEDEARRIEQNGIKTSITFNYIAILKRNIDIARQNILISTYNQAIADFNISVRDLNTFINYRNKQFTPAKPDAAIQGMIDSVANSMERVRAKMNSIKGKDARIDEMIGPFLENYAEATKNVAEHKDFVKKYLSKPKASRKSMFYKRI